MRQRHREAKRSSVWWFTFKILIKYPVWLGLTPRARYLIQISYVGGKNSITWWAVIVVKPLPAMPASYLGCVLNPGCSGSNPTSCNVLGKAKGDGQMIGPQPPMWETWMKSLKLGRLISSRCCHLMCAPEDVSQNNKLILKNELKLIWAITPASQHSR